MPVHRSEEFPPSFNPRNRQESISAARLTREFIDWIFDYENKAEKFCGKRWRGKCLREWENASLKPREIKLGWKSLHLSLEKLSNRGELTK